MIFSSLKLPMATAENADQTNPEAYSKLLGPNWWSYFWGCAGISIQIRLKIGGP